MIIFKELQGFLSFWLIFTYIEQLLRKASYFDWFAITNLYSTDELFICTMNIAIISYLLVVLYLCFAWFLLSNLWGLLVIVSKIVFALQCFYFVHLNIHSTTVALWCIIDLYLIHLSIDSFNSVMPLENYFLGRVLDWVI